MAEPVLLEGGLSVDGRGKVGFVNSFQFEGVKRFYMVENHRSGFIRAWHGHRREAKYVLAVSGSAIVAAVRIDDWDQPSKDLPIHSYVLSESKPSVLHIPAGYANGFMNLTEDTKLVFFSTSTLEESLNDDVRYDARYWDAWTVEER
ncbi:MAG: dTDP-4-dehydrorhamnose 3,5-epimerase family protein [Nitrospinota bacterium]|jgi:dTDP-4-dehydrorhamnose 3,5-epimerase|nr:dTDP-4-dehydrorhamnose 3,5-epimerase family protein [Nitrospinota bacterium]